jgi:hypothetical protein
MVSCFSLKLSLMFAVDQMHKSFPKESWNSEKNGCMSCNCNKVLQNFGRCRSVGFDCRLCILQRKKPVLEIVEQLSQGSRNCWCVYDLAVFLFSWWDDFGCHGWEPAKKEMISVKWVWIILFEITTGRKNNQAIYSALFINLWSWITPCFQNILEKVYYGKR